MRGSIVLGLIFWSSFLFCQNIDSLIDVTQSGRLEPKDRVKNNLKIGNYFKQTDLVRSKLYYEKALNEAVPLGDKLLIANSQSCLGSYYLQKEDMVIAQKLYNEALGNYREVNNKEGESDCLGSISLMTDDPNEALRIQQKANRIRDSLGLDTKLAKGLSNEGNILDKMGRDDEAISSFKKSIDIYKKTNNLSGLTSAYINITGFYGKRNQLDSALIYSQLSLELAKRQNNKNLIGSNLYNIALINYHKKDYKSCFEKLSEAVTIFEATGTDNWIARCRLLMAGCVRLIGDNKRALFQLRQSMSFFQRKDLKSDLANAYNNYAECYQLYQKEFGREYSKNVLDTMALFFKRALKIYITIGDNQKTLLAKSNLAKIEYHKGNYQASIKQFEEIYPDEVKGHLFDLAFTALWNIGKNYNKLAQGKNALSSFEKAEKLALKNNEALLSSTFYEDKSTAFLLEGEVEKSNEALKAALLQKDSLYNIDKNKFIENLEISYQTKKRETENRQLLAEKRLKDTQLKFQRKSLLGSIAALLGLSALAFFLYDQNRKRKKANELLKKQKTEIELLNNELNHRVKNNLAFMTSLLSMQGRRLQSTEAKSALKESESRLQALSVVHNNLMKNSLGKEVNLREYILQIVDKMKESFYVPGKQIEVTTEVDDIAIDAERAMRIGLVVNELFTNSVKYAFQDIGQPNIHISLKQQGNSLSLIYKDNGPGFQQGFENVTGVQEQPQHLGSKLIHLLVEQMQGSLKVTGSEFLSTLPVV